MTDLLKQPDLLTPIVQSGRSRAIAAGVDANEYDTICEELTTAADWPAAFRAAGDRHRQLGDEALNAGRDVSAGEAFFDAAACYHVATTLPSTNRAGHEEAAEAMRRGLELLEPRARQLWGQGFRGTLHSQPDDPAASLVLIVPGLDSSAVEFLANAAALRRRGLATLSIDGPAQGELAPHTTIRADYNTVLSEAIDAVEADPELAPRTIGLMALSLGGFYGALSLARELRLSAGVTVSGPSQLVFDELPPILLAILEIRAGGRDAARSFAAEVDVERFAAEIRSPLLVVDGAADVIPGYVNGAPLAAAAPRGEYLSIEGGDHLVGNARRLWLPRAADFLAEHLR